MTFELTSFAEPYHLRSPSTPPNDHHGQVATDTEQELTYTSGRTEATTETVSRRTHRLESIGGVPQPSDAEFQHPVSRD